MPSKTNLIVPFLYSRPVIMGILNVTPDSFSDGGRYQHIDNALTQVANMLEQGADIIDIGGESTRPHAKPVSEEEEINRVMPVLERIKQEFDALVSIDTSSPELMRLASTQGADMLNDVRALSREGALEAAAQTGLPVCLMHMQGEPQSMQNQPQYHNIVDELLAFFHQQISQATQAGIAPNKLLIDPGFGFGKTVQHNYQLLNQLARFTELNCPILVGLSRKSMLGAVLDVPVNERLIGSVAAALLAVSKGANIVRVHDVKATKQALDIFNMTLKEGQYE